MAEATRLDSGLYRLSYVPLGASLHARINGIEQDVLEPAPGYIQLRDDTENELVAGDKMDFRYACDNSAHGPEPAAILPSWVTSQRYYIGAQRTDNWRVYGYDDSSWLTGRYPFGDAAGNGYGQAPFDPEPSFPYRRYITRWPAVDKVAVGAGRNSLGVLHVRTQLQAGSYLLHARAWTGYNWTRNGAFQFASSVGNFATKGTQFVGAAFTVSSGSPGTGTVTFYFSDGDLSGTQNPPGYADVQITKTA